MKITSFRINGRSISRLSINGKAVSLGLEPALCDALCFTALEAGSTIKLHKNGSAPAVNLLTSTNGRSWTPYTVEDVITLANVDDKVYFKAVGSNLSMGSSVINYNNFVITGKIAASGNINSLLEEDEETARTMSLAGKNYCYCGMFYGCSYLTQAPALPATTLANNCYYGMFLGCNSLTTAPELPATNLASNCYGSMFSLCSSLTSAPALPATTLAEYCYSSMFLGCSSLTQAPALPATELAYGCYANMFSDCTSLTQATELPATTLASNCYDGMFYGCTYLTQAPALPATELAYGCYANMFYNCSSLTSAPALPATTLAEYCYNSMFYGCSSLTSAPALPATNLASNCYGSMFSLCSSLTSAPTLPATTLAEYCYANMFNECYQLNYIKVLFTNWDDTSATENWLPDNSGTFKCPQALIDNTTERTTNTIPESWNIVDLQLYICFTAEEPGSTVKLTKVGSAPDVNLQTSTDGSNWNSYTVEDTITLDNIGDKVYFKAVGSNERMATTDSDYNMFVMTGNIAASGNVNSLLEEDKETAYTMSLEGRDYCYANMFLNCTSLMQAPELPATTLAGFCYYFIFYGCTSLTQAPKLPATTLADYCYAYMFLNCSNLASIDVSFTDWNIGSATYSWLEGVALTGTFRCPQALIDNTTERSDSTVPADWTMTAV